MRGFGFSAWPRDRSMAAIILLAAMTVLGSFAMLPSTEEKVAILMEDGRFGQAIALIEERRAVADLSRYEVFTLNRLYLQAGRMGDAIALLEAEIANRPDSDWARRELEDIANHGLAPARRGLAGLGGPYDDAQSLAIDAAIAPPAALPTPPLIQRSPGAAGPEPSRVETGPAASGRF